MASELGAWTPLPPSALAVVLAAVDVPWWLSGGRALDAFLGRVTRAHEDTDVLILRRDHVQIRQKLADWEAYAAGPPGTLRPWPVDEELPPNVHDVWLRRSPTENWAFQFMIDDTDGDDWIFRRNPRIRRSVASLSAGSWSGCETLAPEIQLLYKSTGLRPKDQLDFDVALPALTTRRREWLRSALAVTSPGHAWLDRL